MTKQEIEKAIENDECVWYSSFDKAVKIDFSKKNKYDLSEFSSIFDDNYKITALVINYTFHYLLKYLFKTKAEAEHYLHHANITRTETLPFLTWEEFLEQKEIKFNSKKSEYLMIYLAGNITIYQCYYNDNGLKLELRIFDEEATKANFYKAYDECVRLFKEGEE